MSGTFSGDPPEPARPRSHLANDVLHRAGLIVTAGSLATLLALAALWARSCWVPEVLDYDAIHGIPKPNGWSIMKHRHCVFESERGVASLTLQQIVLTDTGGVEEYARTNAHGPRIERLPSFSRDRWASCHELSWAHDVHSRALIPFGWIISSGIRLVVPYWVLIVPWAIPPLWWAWCPPGHAFPRLTPRRLMAATAAVAVVLAPLASLWRATAAGRAAVVIHRLGGDVSSVPHLGGTSVSFDPAINDTHLADASSALNSLAGPLSLDLSRSSVTDAGLAHLAVLTRLRSLYLGTGVTDAGLTRLAGLTDLRRLDLRGTRVTAAGIRRLKRSLPHVEISD